MIQRLLIANRGEIVIRIARTAHRLGIDTVGVYSEPDANEAHVDSVDQAVALGGATPADSYLRADAILGAALDTGCDAVHPGYGFLAENADFAQAVIDAGLTWVGPTPDQIRLLGDKIAAKRMAHQAGVPTTLAVEVSPTSIPADTVFPALVKAAAGGGGRGMRVVHAQQDLADAVTSAAREAESAFGDSTVFIEPYLEGGRHIEVQIMGDHHGNVVHLGERECSIQRRNQKIIEESPSAGISAATRAALFDGAVALAHHVGYCNAGTVEFMIGQDDTIVFLEVNTRLQVEHPVTEAVTGLDLVELQLRVAQGDRLPITQADVCFDGHAIEVRVVAETPSTNWQPSVGSVKRFDLASGARVDTGIRAGSEISSHYDSMMAKVITHAPTRYQAVRRMARVLSSSLIVGVNTNLSTLVRIMTDADFVAAETTTAYLDLHPQVMIEPGLENPASRALLLAATFAAESAATQANRVTGFAPSGWRNLRTHGQRRTLLLRGTAHEVEYSNEGDRVRVHVGAWPMPTEDGSLDADQRTTHSVRLLDRTDDRVAIEVDGIRHVIKTSISELGGHVEITTSGPQRTEVFTLAPTFEIPQMTRAGGGPICPLPGTVLDVLIQAGDQVDDGDVLMIVEAMKMEHKITASGESTVTEIHFGVGDRVDQGELLVSLTPID